LSLAGLYRAYALSTLLAGSVEESTKWFEEAVRLAERTNHEGMKAALRTSLILSHVWAGRLRQALTEAQELIDRTAEDLWLGSEILGFSPFLWANFMKGSLLTRMRRLDEAGRIFDQAFYLARKHGDTFVLGHTHHARSLLEWFRGDVEKARACAGEAIEMFERMGSTNQAAYGYLRLGAAQALGREWKASAESLEQALSIAQQRRLLVSEPEILAHLAQAYRGLGQQERALATAEEAVEAACRRGTTLYECDARLALVRILLRTRGAEDGARIEEELVTLGKLVLSMGATSHAPFIHTERAELARLMGDERACQRELHEAQRLFIEMGAIGHAERVARDLA
jgi:tetratricopeptide (TPR) repeat protein